MKKHLSLKLVIAVVALSVYSYMVIKNAKSLNNEQTNLSSQAPQADQTIPTNQSPN